MFSNTNVKNFSSFLPEDERSKNILPGAVVFCLQFQLLCLELMWTTHTRDGWETRMISAVGLSHGADRQSRGLEIAAERGHQFKMKSVSP